MAFLFSKYPHLKNEWDFKKNKEINHNEISHGSSKKVWWLCKKKHSWKAEVKNRGRNKTNCPFCTNKKAGEDNNLKILFPKIAKEWHPTKNGNLRPNNFVVGSSKKIWWKCKKGADHIWRREIVARTGGEGCPYCSGHKVDQKNNIKVKYPKLIQLWNKDKNKGIYPENYSKGSHKLVWWNCDFKKKHIYKMSIKEKINQGYKCPYCRNLRVGSDNNFAFKRPDLVKEWDLKKNKGIKPNNVVATSNKKFWWKCRKNPNHSWYTSVLTRFNGHGCPYCSNQSSTPEMRILSELNYFFPDVISKYKINKVEADIFIPNFNLAIEYDGSYFHKDKNKMDRKKNDFFRSKNIELIRVRHKPLEKISKNDIIVKNEQLNKNDLNKILKTLNQFLKIDEKSLTKYLKLKNFVNERLFKRYISYFPSPLPQNSLISKFPDIHLDWDFKKNYPLEPKNFSPGSETIVWWKCRKYNDHVWQSPIYSRLYGRRGKKIICPICSNRLVTKENNFKYLFPKIALEWNYLKNKNIKPENFVPGSAQKVWWKCIDYGHEWQTSIVKRCMNNTKCPKCYNLKRKGVRRGQKIIHI